MILDATPFNLASELALSVYGKVLDAVRSDRLVEASLERVGDALFVQGRHIDLSHYDRVWLAGSGKASVQMAEAAAQILGEKLSGGLIITKSGQATSIPGITVLEASHPIPDQSSLEAGAQMWSFAQTLGERDLVIYLLSGGSSALMESLHDSLSLDDLQQTNRALLASGLDIKAMNQIRSKLSRVKAGGLARAFDPATVIVMVLSDVIGNDLNAIGSGPFMPIPFSDVSNPAGSSLDLPASVRQALEAGQVLPSPRPPIEHFVIGSVSLAVHAAAEAARYLGLTPLPYADPLKGEAREMAAKICGRTKEASMAESCMIFGGETTIKLRGNGVGGRCQEMAAAAAKPLSGMKDVCFLACGTDGFDGPTDAAGGIVDPGSMRRAESNGARLRDSLANNDSNRFLSACGGLVKTGPTHTNVNDLVLVVHAGNE